MPAILSVTDFSAQGDAAVQYAAALAARIGCSLHVLHPYLLPISLGEMPVPIISVPEMDAISADRMKHLLPKIQPQFPDLRITHQIAFGDWQDIIAEDKESNYLLIVMYGDEAGSSWFGSENTDAALGFEQPVLVIPDATDFRPVKNICLACDAEAMNDPHALQSLVPILKSTGAALSLLHVHTGNGDTANWNNAMLSAALEGISFSLHAVEASGKSIDKAIHDFAQGSGADWLALIPHHYSFFEGLFHKSHTRAAFRFGDLPVLSLH